MFLDLVHMKNLSEFKKYSAPVSACTVGKSCEDFIRLLHAPASIKSAKQMLAYACIDTVVAPDFRNGQVSERAARHFLGAYTTVYYQEEEFSLTNASLPDNQKLIGLARTMLLSFEAMLALFETWRPAHDARLAFLAAAKEYFEFVREWIPRDKRRLKEAAHQLLVFHFLQGLPETDAEVAVLRQCLLRVGGQEALDELDQAKAGVRATLQGLGVNSLGNVQVVSMGPFGLVLAADAPDADAPTTFTEDPALTADPTLIYSRVPRAA
jgi:hypothetical protein